METSIKEAIKSGNLKIGDTIQVSENSFFKFLDKDSANPEWHPLKSLISNYHVYINENRAIIVEEWKTVRVKQNKL